MLIWVMRSSRVPLALHYFWYRGMFLLDSMYTVGGCSTEALTGVRIMLCHIQEMSATRCHI